MLKQRPAVCGLLLAASAALLSLPLSMSLRAQGNPPATPATPADVPMVLHISAREVVIDVIARDQHHNPVNDLAQNEFQVLESPRHGDKIDRKILSMRVIDPRKDASHAGSVDSGFRISTGAVCALNATMHYQLAVQAAQESGNHTTSR